MSLFGSTANNTNNQSKPLFGSSTATTSNPSPFTLGASSTNNANTSQPSPFGSVGGTKPTTSLFGSTNTTNQPAQSGGLFGSANTNAQPAQGGGGLFGSTTTNAQPQQQQQSGGSLFGGALSSNNNTQNQQASGGMFGASTTQQSQPQQTNSLFGATSSNPPAGGSSLFGNTTSQNNTQNKSGLSLFGGNTTNQQGQQQPSLFGASTTAQPTQPSTSLFGASTTTRPGGLTLGQSTMQNQQPVPGVKIDISNVRGTTRFNDLHDELQKQIEQIDTFIQQQIAFKEQCDALMPSHAQTLDTIPNDVQFVQNKLETNELALDNDSSAIDAMKAVVRRDADNARLSFRAVENLKLPQQFHYTGMWQTGSSPERASAANAEGAPVDLVSYVSSTADDFSKTLDVYQRNISEIEAHLRTLEGTLVQQTQQMMFKRGRDGVGRTKDEQVRELAAVLREFEGGILNVAGHVGQVKEDVAGVVEGGAAAAVDGRGGFGRR